MGKEEQRYRKALDDNDVEDEEKGKHECPSDAGCYCDENGCTPWDDGFASDAEYFAEEDWDDDDCTYSPNVCPGANDK